MREWKMWGSPVGCIGYVRGVPSGVQMVIHNNLVAVTRSGSRKQIDLLLSDTVDQYRQLCFEWTFSPSLSHCAGGRLQIAS